MDETTENDGKRWCETVDESMATGDVDDTLPPAPINGLAAWIRNDGCLDEFPALALLDEIRTLRLEREELEVLLQTMLCLGVPLPTPGPEWVPKENLEKTFAELVEARKRIAELQAERDGLRADAVGRMQHLARLSDLVEGPEPPAPTVPAVGALPIEVRPEVNHVRPVWAGRVVLYLSAQEARRCGLESVRAFAEFANDVEERATKIHPLLVGFTRDPASALDGAWMIPEADRADRVARILAVIQEEFARHVAKQPIPSIGARG